MTNDVAAVSIDVDGTGCYHEIHGLPPPARDPIYERALPRFLALCDRVGLKATLFVVGRDLVGDDAAPRRDVLRRAVQDGHEVASHSFAHDYGLSRRGPAEIAADLARADDAIFAATGARPVGFRAPGYNQSDALLDAVEGAGHRYDSSYMPTPAYFALRATAIALYRARRRPSRSLVGDVREFLAPRAPFVPSRTRRWSPARDDGDRRALIEIPISVASTLRLPWIGTNLTLFPDAVGRRLTRAVLHDARPAILELHAIDFAGADDGFDGGLVSAQADLQVATAVKLRRLEDTFRALKGAREVATLATIAARVRDTRGSPTA